MTINIYGQNFKIVTNGLKNQRKWCQGWALDPHQAVDNAEINANHRQLSFLRSLFPFFFFWFNLVGILEPPLII
jgi:hypothetical protein